MKLGCDTGGTFTDLVVLEDGRPRVFKAPTTPQRPIDGIMETLRLAAESSGRTLRQFLGSAEVLVHGTTHPLNAVLTRRTAKTALLVTRGHRDILTLREGGRADPFDKMEPFPSPYVPRALTYEVDERVLWNGVVEKAVAVGQIEEIVESLKREHVEAVAVCLLWSIRNPNHENAVRQVLAAALPSCEVSISSDVSPMLREFRRASATALDASLKGFVRRYLADLVGDLRHAGLHAPIMLAASDGSMLDPELAVARPISLINSGPAMAPVAAIVAVGSRERDLIVSDTGGTTFDVSVVRGGMVPISTENFVGSPRLGLFCGYPSAEIQSIGAGGGSIAWVDDGGLLRIGPQSVGAAPGPACYGQGGTFATLTDAAVARGIVNPERFLGGRLPLDPRLAHSVIKSTVADPLGLSVEDAATRIMRLATESMVRTIEEATMRHGVDPSQAVFVGGGGAAGFNVVRLAGLLGCPRVVFPGYSPVLSAFGMTVARPCADARRVVPVRSDEYDQRRVQDLIDALSAEAKARMPHLIDAGADFASEVFAAARYEGQVWELELRIEPDALKDVGSLVAAFHERHRELYGFHDVQTVIEFLSWRVRVIAAGEASVEKAQDRREYAAPTLRNVYLESAGLTPVPVYSLSPTVTVEGVGPAIVESEYSTIFVEGRERFRSNNNGDLEVEVA